MNIDLQPLAQIQQQAAPDDLYPKIMERLQQKKTQQEQLQQSIYSIVCIGLLAFSLFYTANNLYASTADAPYSNLFQTSSSLYK